MRLHVGILGTPHPGWSHLMEQEGVSYSFVNVRDSTETFSVLIIGDIIDAPAADYVRSFLRHGGSILCSGHAFESLTGKKGKRAYVKHILPKPGDSLYIPGIIDIEMDCVLPNLAGEYLTNTGESAIYVGDLEGGHVVVLPFHPHVVILDNRNTTRTFFAPRNRMPFERVSMVSKGGIRRLVSRSLELLHHKRGLPYVRKSCIPENGRSIFALRIDTDYANRTMIEELSGLAKRHAVPLTWFIDVGSQRDFLNLFAGYATDEIGIHCYDHVSYPDKQSNLANIGKARAALESVGVHATSFASPYGTWNEGIAGAVDESQFVYSSEFSYDYDNLPSHPQCEGRLMKSLQLPVHPISIGSLRRQGFSTEEMKMYFDTVADRSIALGEPLFVYHHPGDGNPEILEHLFNRVKEAGVHSMTMGAYAVWWKRRTAVTSDFAVDGDQLSIRTKNTDRSVGYRISVPDGREAFIATEGIVNLSSLHWDARSAVLPLPVDYARIRKFNPWVPLIRFEDMLSKRRK